MNIMKGYGYFWKSEKGIDEENGSKCESGLLSPL